MAATEENGPEIDDDGQDSQEMEESPQTQTQTDRETKECRICKDVNDPGEMISPCLCSGTLKYVHKNCLLDWVRARREPNKCGVCNSYYECTFILRRARFGRFVMEEKKNLFYAILLTLFITFVLAGTAYLLLRMDLQTYKNYVNGQRRNSPEHKDKPINDNEFLIFKFMLVLENVAAIVVLWLCFSLAVLEEWSKYKDYYFEDDPNAPIERDRPNFNDD